MKRYFWDFFGPRAQPTAEHFMKHLDQLLDENAISGCTTGLCSEQAGHAAVFLRAPPELATTIERSLSPKRVIED
jgi:hypothetical protein